MRRAVLAIVIVFFTVQTGHVIGGEAGAPLRAWDQIITEELFSDIAKFAGSVEQRSSDRVYVFSFSDKQDKLTMSIAVMVGPAGKRLPPNLWSAAKEAADEEKRRREFPEIGLRAQAAAPKFSPTGALSAIDFTTGDNLFDVRVSVFEASSAEPRGSLEAVGAARRVEQAYNATFR